MHEVASAWLMTSLTQSPLMIALMQTANYLPILLIGIPAGAVADLSDRRRIVLVGMTWMLLTAAALGVITILGLTTPWLLLALTFVMAMGGASVVPAFGVLTQDLVKPEQVHAALAINSSGRHVARGVGSALGGIILAVAGAGVVFLINAASFAAILAVLSIWCASTPHHLRAKGEFWEAIRTGFNHTLRSKTLLTTNALTALFGLSSSALWALLPLFARRDIGMTAFEYGLAMSAFGAGSLLGVSSLAWLRSVFSFSGAAAVGVLLMAASLAAVAFSTHPFHVLISMCLAGTAWIVVVSALNTYVQQSSESSVRSRSVAIFATVWQSSLALGSFVWGLIASGISIRTTYYFSAGSLVIVALIFATRRLSDRKSTSSR